MRAARGDLGAADGRRVWISRSYDRGRRWEPPREITADVKREGWTWYATGPGGAVELEDGTIAVPATHAVAGEVGAGAPGYGAHFDVCVVANGGASPGLRAALAALEPPPRLVERANARAGNKHMHQDFNFFARFRRTFSTV